MSCFICEVILENSTVELIDSGHHLFIIDKDDEALMKDFKKWFVTIYKECVPQTLTVVQYHVEDNDGEPVMKVDKLIWKKKDSSLLNESDSKNKGEIL